MKSIRLYILLTILGLPMMLSAQRGGGLIGGGSTVPTISGSTFVTAGQSYNYTVSQTAGYWNCVSCEFQFPTGYNPATQGWPSTVTVKWSVGGSQPSISATTIGMQTVTLQPGVTCSNELVAMPNPSAITQTPNYCIGQVTLTHPMQNGELSYYWQTSSGGASTSNGSANYTVSSSGTYYLRAKNQWGCWGANYVAVVVVVPTSPIVDTPILVTDCGPARLELNNTNTTDFTYYWQNSATGTDLTHAELSRAVITEGDFFVRAYHNVTACWSTASTGLHVAPETIAEQAPNDPNLVNTPTNEASGEVVTNNTNKPTGANTTITGLNNFVRSYKVLDGSVTTYAELASKGYEAVSMKTVYFDGLGRPLQEVQRAASPDDKDVVVYHQYDQFGRETKQFLPYADGLNNGDFKTNAPTKQYDFYQGISVNNTSKTDWAFSEIELETSPLNRVLSQMQAGKSWVGEGRKASTELRMNTELEGIRIWKVIDHIDGTMELAKQSEGMPISPVTWDIYRNNQLTVNKMTDEQGNSTWEYKNKRGQLILAKTELGDGTYAQTYYVYDDFGQVRYILPPMATQFLSEKSWDPKFGGNAENIALFKALIFHHKYDHRGRMTVKQLPSQRGETYMVYDKMDRLILVQNPEQRKTKTWAFTQYDVFGRPAATGLCDFINKSQEQLQAEINGQIPITTFNRTSNDYDLASNFPQNHAAVSNIMQLTVTYYDTYEALDGLQGYDFQTVPEFGAVTEGTLLHKLPE